MSRNWDRYIDLTVGSGGQQWNLSAMRIKFKVTRKIMQTPGLLEARIYNLSKGTRDKIAQQDYSEVSLDVGYKDNHGVIYKGKVEQKRIGRETPTETFLDLFAQDSGLWFNYGKTMKTLPPNHSREDALKSGIEEGNKTSGEKVEIGHIGPDLSQKYTKAGTYVGQVRKVARDISHSVGANWWIENSKLNMLKPDQTMPGEAIEVSATTGLIGSPTQTYDTGIIFRHLINPQFGVGKKIHYKSDTGVLAAQFDLTYSGASRNALISEIAPDGIYKIVAMDYQGDSRGQTWYVDMYCISAAPGVKIPDALL